MLQLYTQAIRGRYQTIWRFRLLPSSSFKKRNSFWKQSRIPRTWKICNFSEEILAYSLHSGSLHCVPSLEKEGLSPLLWVVKALWASITWQKMNSQHPKSAKRRTWLVCEVDSHQGQIQGIRTGSRTTSFGSDTQKRQLSTVVSRTNTPTFSNTKRKHFSSMWITPLIGT